MFPRTQDELATFGSLTDLLGAALLTEGGTIPTGELPGVVDWGEKRVQRLMWESAWDGPDPFGDPADALL